MDTFREQLFFLVLCLSVLKGNSRYIEDNEIVKDGLYSFFNSELKRELSEEFIYRRPLRCLDMVALEGQYTFTADRPQLNCAAFFIAGPGEVISVEYDNVDIDCRAGDFIKVFDGWAVRGETFPSSQDHELRMHERYVDFCDAGSLAAVRSSQNVAMVFFRIHGAGSTFTFTARKLLNPFPCNVVSQTPEGSFTMTIPEQRRNCSFSIVYPVEVQITEFSLGHGNHLPVKRSSCMEAGDAVELLGGNGMDTSKMFPIADLCHSFAGPTRMKIGCDHSVVRMVSSGRFTNRVSFNYRLLSSQELQRIKLNSVEDFCFNDQ